MQNHILVVQHLVTAAGSWIPQFLQGKGGREGEEGDKTGKGSDVEEGRGDVVGEGIGSVIREGELIICICVVVICRL